MTASATVPTVTPAIRPTEDEPSSVLCSRSEPVRGRTWKQKPQKDQNNEVKDQA